MTVTTAGRYIRCRECLWGMLVDEVGGTPGRLPDRIECPDRIGCVRKTLDFEHLTTLVSMFTPKLNKQGQSILLRLDQNHSTRSKSTRTVCSILTLVQLLHN